MIYDCFMFYNELDLLWLRLNELDGIVDKFILVESPMTFTHQPKPLYYTENKKRFTKFNHKIIHIVSESYSAIRIPWIVEFHQTNMMMNVLKNCKPNDIILLSCPDELPKKEKILEFQKNKGKHKKFINKQCYYFLNWIGFGANDTVPCNSMYSFRDLQKYPDLYTARFCDFDVPIEEGGWHYSYMGGEQKIREKMAAWSHQEYNNDTYNTVEYIRLMLRKKQDLLKTGLKFRKATDQEMPEYLATHKDEFLSLFDQRFEQTTTLFEEPYLQSKRQLRLLYRNIRRMTGKP